MTETQEAPRLVAENAPLYLFEVNAETWLPASPYVALAHDAEHAISLVRNAYESGETYGKFAWIARPWPDGYAEALVAEKLIEDPITGPCAAWLGDQE